MAIKMQVSDIKAMYRNIYALSQKDVLILMEV